jgi:hypothetical protein
MNQDQISTVTDLFKKTSITGESDLALVFDVLLYFEGSASQHWPGIRRFFEISLELIRDDVKYYVIDGRAKFRRVDNEVFSMLDTWADGSTAERTLYGLTLRGGQLLDEASDFGFDLYADSADPGYVRLLLPARFGCAESSLSLALSLAAGIDFISGTAGFAVSMRRDYSATKVGGDVYALSRRFKGVDFGKPHMFASHIAEGLKSVNWLTFLGTQAVANCGGATMLEAGASLAPLKVHKLSRGIALQAGELPILGDVNRRESLDAYRAANSILLGSRFPLESLNGYDGIGGEENTVDWITRFDE